MALLPQDKQSQVMMLITLGMLALGYAFWNYWAKPTGEEITAIQTEIKSMEDVTAQAKQDLASGTREGLPRSRRRSRISRAARWRTCAARSRSTRRCSR